MASLRAVAYPLVHRSGRAGSAASGSSTDGFATRRRVPAGPGSQAMATAIPKAYLASSAIRCRDVETGPNLGVLAVFPSTGATCRCPLPSTGSRGRERVPAQFFRHGLDLAGGHALDIHLGQRTHQGLLGPETQFPRFGGTMRHSDSSPSIPPRFVAFARRYHPSTCGFAPSDARCCVHGLGRGEPVPAPRRSLRWRRRPRGLPGSRETHPHACHALRPRRGRRLHGL